MKNEMLKVTQFVDSSKNFGKNEKKVSTLGALALFKLDFLTKKIQFVQKLILNILLFLFF